MSTPDNLLARRVPPTKKYIKYLAQCTYPTRRAPSTASTPDWKVPAMAQWELPIGKYLARWVSPIRKYLARCVPPTRDVAVPCTPEPWELVLDHRTEGWASRRVRRGINQHDLPVKRQLSSKFTLYLYVTKPGMKRTTKRKIFFEKIKYKQWYWTTSVVIFHLKKFFPIGKYSNKNSTSDSLFTIVLHNLREHKRYKAGISPFYSDCTVRILWLTLAAMMAPVRESMRRTARSR